MKKIFKKFLEKGAFSNSYEIEDSVMTATEKEKAFLESKHTKRGLNFLWAVVLIVFSFLLFRVFYLDYVRGEYFSELSKGNRIREVIVKSPRGKILDRYGKILAKNVPSIDVVVFPSDFLNLNNTKEETIGLLSKVLDLERGNLEIIFDEMDEKSLKPVLIKENISQEEALILGERIDFLAGISLEKSAIRNYENGYIFSHVIGYDGKINWEELKNNPEYLMTDYIGKAGIEKEYEKELRGVHGAKLVEVDSLGNAKKNLGVKGPEPGNDLILNIDEGLQKKLYDSLSTVLEKTETRTAAAVAIDPRNGGILAMVSLPSFDNNLFARGIADGEYRSLIEDNSLPLFNRVIKGEYPPGSTIKPAIAVAALSERVIDEHTTVDCAGGISLGAFHFGDWKTHGVTDVRKAIAESCDIFFYSIGGGYANIPGLGVDRMEKYAHLFGFGQITGVDISGEMKGVFPTEKWKEEKIGERWYIGNSYHASIGQGYVTATPLQLANYTAALANGGTLFSPRLVSKIKKNNGEEKVLNPQILRSDFVNSEIMKIVREGMRQTVESGTARSLQSVPVQVAGKTGTAEFGVEKGHTHAWFVSFAPYDNPEIAMVVLAEGAGEGHSSAVPVTKEVLEWYFSR